MRVDGKFLAVNGKSIFDGTFAAVTQHDGKFFAVDGFLFFDRNVLAVDGNSTFDGKSPVYRDRPPVRYFLMSENLPNTSLDFLVSERDRRYVSHYFNPPSVRVAFGFT